MKSPERRSVNGRVYLVLQDRDDADRLAHELDAMGWLCAVAAEEQDHGVSRIRDAKPMAVIADGSDLGISIAAAMRADSSTRATPIIFIHASKAVDRINAAVPGPIFASRSALDYVLNELVERSSES